jgi:DNA-binding winged helix-turn-helix (wHTH) protein
MLTELYKYLEFMNYKKNIKQKEQSLQGVWKGKGFEKIDVEKEIYKLRANVSQKLEKINL